MDFSTVLLIFVAFIFFAMSLSREGVVGALMTTIFVFAVPVWASWEFDPADKYFTPSLHIA